MKAKEKEKLLKAKVRRLVKKEFGDLVVGFYFSGPWEGEDLDVDVILKEFPPDLSERSYRVRERLWEEDYDVLIGYELPTDGQEVKG